MDKKDILEQAQAEHTEGFDEMEEQIEDKAASVTVFIMSIVCLIIYIIKWRFDQPAWDCLGLIALMIGTRYAYYFFRLRQLSKLIGAIAWLGLGIALLIFYVRILATM